MARPTFRPAGANDRAAWIDLRHELWPECPRERHALEVEQILGSKGIVVLAEVAGLLVGFAEVSIRVDQVEGTESAPVPYLEGWYVREPHRRQGVGRGLIRRVEQWASAAGYRELASDAELANEHAIRLHRQLGFTEVGRSVNFVKRLG